MKRALLALTSLLFALAAAEGAARMWAPTATATSRGAFTTPGEHPSHTPEYDVVVHVNAAGWVDQEWGARAGRRTVVIGDSFVQAAQVRLDQGFGRLLDAALPGDVRSLGEPGAGTAMELELLDVALQAQPDLVLLGFLSANDVVNNHPLLEDKLDKAFYRMEGDTVVRAAPADWLTPAGPWSRSALFRWMSRAVLERRLTAEKVRIGNGVPIDYRLFDPAGGPVWDEAWALTETLLREMAARCARAHVAFGILVFPGGITATESGRQHMLATWPGAAGWDVVAPHTRSVAMARTIAPTLDLLPTLQGRDDAYFVADGHWTALGHQLAAQATAAWLRTEPTLGYATASSPPTTPGAPP